MSSEIAHRPTEVAESNVAVNELRVAFRAQLLVRLSFSTPRATEQPYITRRQDIKRAVLPDHYIVRLEPRISSAESMAAQVFVPLFMPEVRATAAFRSGCAVS
jgi:hypothetical protein